MQPLTGVENSQARPSCTNESFILKLIYEPIQQLCTIRDRVTNSKATCTASYEFN